MKVVSVKFKENGRAYYFDPGEFKIKEGDFVVVTTARGTECGEVVRAAHEVPGFSREVKPVIRVADAVDVRRMRQNRADVQQAYHICEQRIAAHNLKMKLVDAEYTLDRSKLVFYFTADNRVDFRELVKDLAGQFHTLLDLQKIISALGNGKCSEVVQRYDQRQIAACTGYTGIADHTVQPIGTESVQFINCLLPAGF